MIARCYHKNFRGYKNWGGRGIVVCERWRHSFQNFLTDMGLRPAGKSLDRHPDNDGNYEPGNCRWATRLEQRHNARPRQGGQKITFLGRSQSIFAWAKELGINRTTLKSRLSRGVNLERALTGKELRCLRNVNAPEGLAWCFSCQAYKPRSKFNSNRYRKNGLQAKCRSCESTRSSG